MSKYQLGSEHRRMQWRWNNGFSCFLLEEEFAGEKSNQDVNGICDGAAENSVGHASGCA